jgi:hypothetical protein
MSAEPDLADTIAQRLDLYLYADRVAAAVEAHSTIKRQRLLDSVQAICEDFVDWVVLRSEDTHAFGPNASVVRGATTYFLRCDGEFSRLAMAPLRAKLAEALSSVPHTLVYEPQAEFGADFLTVRLL